MPRKRKNSNNVGVYMRCDSAHQCLNTKELGESFWNNLEPEQRYQKAISIGLDEKIAIMLFHGYQSELANHYKTTKIDIIPRELLFDWFLKKNYSNLSFDDFKFKTIVNKSETETKAREIEEKDFDVIHTQFRSQFPWCNYLESACYKKILAFSQDNRIDSKINALDSLELTEKVTSELIKELIVYLEISDREAEIAEIYLTVWFTGLIHRSLNPGAKFDLVLVLHGIQGVGKNTFLENIYPNDTYVMSNSRDLDSKDKLVNLSSNSIVIWDEIGSFTGKYMTESIKQFLTLCHDSYRPVYGRQMLTRGRRCVFAATTNDPDILDDLSGSRRFMVISVGTKSGVIAQNKIRELMPTLISAVKRDYEKGVLLPYFTKEQAEKQYKHNEKYSKEDPLKQLVEEWVNSPGVTSDLGYRDYFTTIELAESCLAIPGQTLNRTQTCHIGRVLRTLGYRSKKARFGSGFKSVWYKVLVYQANKKESKEN